ncbi:MAG: peptide synthase [Pirellulaceae bacterium]|nr:MAG: peptide synthase [Pirellulaceae bacterium]
MNDPARRLADQADGELSANVASRLTTMASQMPSAAAIAVPVGRYKASRPRDYTVMSFADLELASSSIAAGLQQMGIEPGMRIVLLVRFGAEFITLVFALMKVGAIIVLVDPGMGRKNLIRCLEEARPDGFIGIPLAHVVRMATRHRFPQARFNVTVGRRYGFLPHPTLEQLSGTPSGMYCPPQVELDTPAAIIFTTGSTGPPKGVLYTHRTFHGQVDAIQQHYGIEPGGVDLSGFPLFGLFNAVMGTTTVIPDMDPTRPADVDPPRILDAIDQWQVDQAFGSPALWTRVGRYAQEVQRTVPSLRRVFSAGAPVPPQVLRWVRRMMPEDGQMFTPYGATEALPVASIESREVLEQTASLAEQGAGTCVGRKFDGIQWKVIAIDDGPLQDISQVRELGVGEIGELMVRGEVVTQQYVTRCDQNALHKVADGDQMWHRMGDVGYLDDQGRFWCCGRKSQRVQTAAGTLFTEQVEAVFNNHPRVHRTALVGTGSPPQQRPVLVIETWPEHRPRDDEQLKKLIAELRQLGLGYQHTRSVEQILLYPDRLPTDIRHNSKIFREQLAQWVMRRAVSPSLRGSWPRRLFGR